MAWLKYLSRFHEVNSVREKKKAVPLYSSSSTIIKEFQYSTQFYHLTFHDIYVFLTNNLLS